MRLRRHPQIVLPTGYKAQSGLYLPSEFVVPQPVEVPPELIPEAEVLVVAQAPSFIDQVWVFATQEELGLDVTPRDVVIELARAIPFWPAMKMLARYQRDLWPVRTNQEGQANLVERWYGPESKYTDRAKRFLSGGERRVLFSEQQFFALQKLLILYAKDSDPDQEFSGNELLWLMIALAAIPGSLLGPQAEELASHAGGQVSDETWLRLFIGHGGFIGSGSIKHQLARAYLLYVVGANTEAARNHTDYCPLDEWLIETFGVSLLELEAVGFSLWAGSKMGDPEETPVLVDNSYFAPTAIADRSQLALDALSCPREWYRDLFAKSVDDERRTAFEITPFLQRPALRFDDGRVMPFAPRAMEGWLGATGAYYRLFDIAISKGSAVRERFTRFNGFLVEEHVVANAEAAHPAMSATVWVPRVIPEQVQQTAEGESRTPDVVLDYGRDLVVVEVTSGRPTAQSIVDADPDSIRKDIEKLLEVKIAQLGDRIKDLRNGTLTLPDVQMANVARIWPIVVNSEGLLQTPSLWSYLREEVGVLAALDQPGVQPLTLLDVEDIERLMGLTAESHQLISILESKTQPGWQEREFASWYEVEGHAFGSSESTFIGDALLTFTDELVKILLGDQTREEYEAKVQALRRPR